MDDEFFTKIGEKVAQQAIQRERAVAQTDNVRVFQGSVVDRLAPIAEDYVAKLGRQGVTAEFEKNALGLSFTMRWQDSGHWSLILGPSHELSGLQFYNDFTNDDGKTVRSTDGATFSETTWKDELFSKRLQKAIEDYVFYSDRHGGMR